MGVPRPRGAGSTDTGDADAGSTLPALSPDTCGAEPDAYPPLEGLGRLVDHEQDVAWSLPAAAIEALLDAQGLGDLLDARYDVSLHKVRYITQDRGVAVETTGYVAFPELEVPAEVPTMLWTLPTLGFGDACAPSTGSLEGAAFPVLAAAMGYAVAAPDYPGMNGWGAPSDRMHPRVVGEPTALASLDSLRATAEDFAALAAGIIGPEDVYTAEALQRAAEDTLQEWVPRACYQRESSLLQNTAVEGYSRVPKLLVIGSEDTLARAPPVRADAEALCAVGVPIERIACEGLGHVDAAVESLPLYLQWAEARLAGTPLRECDLQPPSDCRADGGHAHRRRRAQRSASGHGTRVSGKDSERRSVSR